MRLQQGLTCDSTIEQAAHDAVYSGVGVRGHGHAAAAQRAAHRALPQEEVDGRHQQHALARSKGPVHHAQRAGRLRSSRTGSVLFSLFGTLGQGVN